MKLEKILNEIENNIHNEKNIYNILNKYNEIDWQNYIKSNEIFSKDNNTNKLLIENNEKYNVYLINWKSESSEKLENINILHIYKILQGHLIEEQYNKKKELIGFKSLFKNNISYNIIQNKNIYEYCYILNNLDYNSISLNIFSPPFYF